MQMLIFHRPVSCTCGLQINSACIQHRSVSRVKKHTISLSSENQLWKDHAVPMTDDFCQHKNQKKKAAIDVFQVAWITSIDSFDRSGKPLFCNGRRFRGRWVFPFCNILRAGLGTESHWTGGSWLGPDNGTSSEPQRVERKDQSNHEALLCPWLTENVYFIPLLATNVT